MKLLYTLFILCCSLAVFAQSATLLDDINPGEDGSNPTRFTAIGDLLYFRADAEGTTDVEPYITNGTPEGTRLLLEINPDSDAFAGNSNPTDYIQYKDHVYFQARTGTTGAELWRTDGTAEGTNLFFDLQPGEDNGAPFDFVIFNDLLYFTANDGVNSSELWVTDGTADGTMLVVDIREGNAPGNPNFKTVFNDRLLFTANNGTEGNELYISDGTAEGTMMIADIRPGSGSASPGSYFVADSIVYFRANDGETGIELYRTDGTVEGTYRIADLNPDGNSRPDDFFSIGSTVYFTAEDSIGSALYQTRGDSMSTQLVFRSNATGDSDPRLFTRLNDSLYLFQANLGEDDTTATLYTLIPSTVDVPIIAPVVGSIADLPAGEIEEAIFDRNTLYFSFTEAGSDFTGLYKYALDSELAPISLFELAEGDTLGGVSDLTLFNDLIVFEGDNGETGREPYVITVDRFPGRLTVTSGVLTLVNDDTLNVNDVPANTDSTVTILLTNSGEEMLVIDSVRLTDDGDFTLLTSPDTIMGGMTDTVRLSFPGGAVGSYTDALSLFSSDSTNNGVFTVNLRATVIVNSTRTPVTAVASLFPNPTVQDITIELRTAPVAGSWQLYSNEGRLLRHGVWPARQLRHRLDVSDLPTGAYRLLIQDNKEAYQATFIKR
jgi:ELWxxDGT repeat protein